MAFIGCSRAQSGIRFYLVFDLNDLGLTVFSRCTSVGRYGNGGGRLEADHYIRYLLAIADRMWSVI